MKIEINESAARILAGNIIAAFKRVGDVADSVARAADSVKQAADESAKVSPAMRA